MNSSWSKTFLLSDERGMMGVVEETDVPFEIRRMFWLANIPQGEVRGQHAHLSCEQFIICAHGTVALRAEYHNGPTESAQMEAGDTFYLQLLTWLTLSDFSEDALVIVLASEPYDESEYIRSYEEFLRSKR